MSDFQAEVNKHYTKQVVEMAKAHANKTISDAYEALQEENEKLKQRELELMDWMDDSLSTLQAFSKTFEEYSGVMVMFDEVDELSHRANQLRQQADK